MVLKMGQTEAVLVVLLYFSRLPFRPGKESVCRILFPSY